MTRTTILIILLQLFLACVSRDSGQPYRQQSNAPEFRVQTFKVKAGWGYSVFVNDKEYIRQRFIPVVDGEIPFATANQALDVGNYIVHKLKSDRNPSLTREELQQLHVTSVSASPSH
jgi:hypothetical protein